jgi:hypothetical protein
MQQWRPAMDMIYIGLAGFVFLTNALVAITGGLSAKNG